MNKRTTILGICIVTYVITGLSIGTGWAQSSSNAKSSTLTERDKTFMHNAAKGGIMEVAMGKVAEQKAQSDDVKSFGKRMVSDHSKANDELKKIAAEKNVELPSKEPSEKWTSDRAYMNMMVRDHEKDLAEFKREASNGSDPDVKKFANDTAKVIEEHLNLAKETQSKLK